jgi:glycosyltransferase involved in cell wall biosynthesis
MDELAANLRRFGEVSRADLPNTYRRPTRSLGAAFDFAQHRRIGHMFRELAPDVVHVNQQVAEDGLDLLLAAHGCGLPFLSTVHIVQSATSLDARFGRVRDLVTSTVFRRANAVHITVAERARGDLLARFGFLAAHQVKVVLNGVFFAETHDARERTRARWGAAVEDVVIGSVGRLEAQKGPDVALQVIAALAGEGLPVRYVWIGDGPMRAPFLQQAQRLGIAGRINVDGWRDDIADCLQGLDVFIMPSRFEGMPLALLEAMGAGLCCFASEVDGIGEAIQHGVTGHLCAPGNIAKWCEQIAAVVADSVSRAEVGRRARDFARARFSIDGMAAATVAIYQDVLRLQQEARLRKSG